MITHHPSYPTPCPFYCPGTRLGLVPYMWGRASGKPPTLPASVLSHRGLISALTCPQEGHATSSLPEPLSNAPLSVCPEPLQLQSNPCSIHVFMLYSEWRQISIKAMSVVAAGLAQRPQTHRDSGLIALGAAWAVGT